MLPTTIGWYACWMLCDLEHEEWNTGTGLLGATSGKFIFLSCTFSSKAWIQEVIVFEWMKPYSTRKLNNKLEEERWK